MVGHKKSENIDFVSSIWTKDVSQEKEAMENRIRVGSVLALMGILALACLEPSTGITFHEALVCIAFFLILLGLRFVLQTVFMILYDK